MKNKTALGVLIVFLLLVVGGGLMFLFNNNNQTSDIEEKSQILTAVMRKWKNNEIKVNDNNLKLIKSVKSKAGEYPYQYQVIFEMKNGYQIIYGWKDKNKNGIKEVK